EVVYAGEEAGPRGDAGHTRHENAREELRPRHLERVEERLGGQVEPLEEARVERDARGIRFRPPHPDVDPFHGAGHRYASACSLSRKRWSLPVSLRASSRTTPISRGR